MARLILALLMAVSLFLAPTLGSAAAHGGPGGCLAPVGASAPDGMAHPAHHHQREAPAKAGGAVVPCCLAVAPGFPPGALPLVVRDDAGLAAPRFGDDVGHGLAVEPAERPPRFPFPPSA